MGEGDGLQHGNAIAVLHNKTAGLANVADNVNDTRLADENRVTRFDGDVIGHGFWSSAQQWNPNRVVRIVAARNQRVRPCLGGGSARSGDRFVELP